jgi:hypothetical protein
MKLLKQLPVKTERQAGYSRAKFVHWIDADGDGCDTRQEVLIAEAVKKPRIGAGCRLYGGVWVSTYDGQRFTTYGGMDVDHMVPLAEAWASGARNWNSATRRAFANDLAYRYSLNAISAHSNRSKGDREPGSWMPTKASYRCIYVKSWIAVKWRWHLAVDASEKASLVRNLKACGSYTVARPTRARVVAGSSGGGPVKPPPSGLDPRFSTCTAAKAAGYGPYYRGVDPEYAWYRDADNDGIVCE